MSKNTTKKGKGTDATAGKAPAKASAKGVNVSTKSGKAAALDEPPAPQISKAVFPGWTGKTPSSLLHEHCQKLDWEKPTFDVVRLMLHDC
ncbi:hypothetical protein EDD11_009040 [Mortierella claussenii]|nr:hypothetical protein EDD11_009040 [Mortierella claussenii]